MFSQLGPLFKTTFRHAESTDTRQMIHHEDKNKGRKKGDDERPDDDSDMWEDSTRVSVDALRTFLINFLNGATVQTGLAAAAQNTPAASTPPPRPANPATARAAGAYQSMADKLEPHHYTPPAPVADLPADEGPTATDADLLHAAELRLMHELIVDLDALDKAGVLELVIEPAESFLEGLRIAVQNAKSTG